MSVPLPVDTTTTDPATVVLAMFVRWVRGNPEVEPDDPVVARVFRAYAKWVGPDGYPPSSSGSSAD